MTENSTVTPPTDEDLVEALKDVIDPELGINIVDLGLLYGITLDGNSAIADMTLTSADRKSVV